MDKIIYSCNDHIEDLLDFFLDEIEEMPLMEEIKKPEIMCHECKEQALYMLLRSDVKAKWE